MSQAVNHVELLMHLGLTLNEAKVYITLSEMETATARALSRNSGVTREFIYQILPKLYGKGIVEVAITTPKTFKAVPLKEAYEILMNHREKENKELQQKIKTNSRHRNCRKDFIPHDYRLLHATKRTKFTIKNT